MRFEKRGQYCALIGLSMLIIVPFSHAKVIDQLSSVSTHVRPVTPELHATVEKGQILPHQTATSQINVPMVFRYTYSSNQLKAGDIIQAEVMQDVYNGDMLLFKKGSEGLLTIKSSKKAHMLGKGGKIEIESGQITDESGQAHQIQIPPQSERIKGNSYLGPVILPLIAHYYPPMALLSFYGLKKGDDAVIPAGKVLFVTIPLTETSQASIFAR